MAIKACFTGLSLGSFAQIIPMPRPAENNERGFNPFIGPVVQTINIYIAFSILSEIAQTLKFTPSIKGFSWKIFGVCYLTPQVAQWCSSKQKDCSFAHKPFNLLHHHISDLCYVAVCVSFCALIYFGHYVAGGMALGWMLYQALKQHYHWKSWTLNKVEQATMISLDAYNFIHGTSKSRLLILGRYLYHLYLYNTEQKMDKGSDSSSTLYIDLESAHHLRIEDVKITNNLSRIFNFFNYTPQAVLFQCRVEPLIAKYIENSLISGHMAQNNSTYSTDSQLWMSEIVRDQYGDIKDAYLIYFLINIGVFQLTNQPV